MANAKVRLTQQEKMEHVKQLNALRAEGIDATIPEEWQLPSPRVHIAVFEDMSRLITLPSGRSGFYVQLRLQSAKKMTLVECRIECPVDDAIVLESTPKDLPKPPRWRGKSGPCPTLKAYFLGNLQVPEEEVLNQRIESGLKLSPNAVAVQGLIIATGIKTLPAAYPHGTSVRAEIILVDSQENESRQSFRLVVDRSQENTPISRALRRQLRKEPQSPVIRQR